MHPYLTRSQYEANYAIPGDQPGRHAGAGVVLNILFSVLGINKSSISGLLVFCAVFGFGGSFISLLMSKWMAKRSYGVQVIEQPRNETEHWLVSTVARQAREAGIKMPEVGIYDSPR